MNSKVELPMTKQKHNYSTPITMFLIALHLNGILFCMEIEPFHNLNLELLKTIPAEIMPRIAYFAAPPQWWYPQETYKSKKWVYGTYFDAQDTLIEITELQGPMILQPQVQQFVCFTDRGHIPRSGYFDSSEQRFITTSSGKVVIFDSNTHQQIDLFEHYREWIYDICLDSSKQFLATGAENCNARIFNMETRQIMHSFRHDHRVISVCFNQSGKLFTTVSGNRFMHMFAQYDDYSLWQLILKQT